MFLNATDGPNITGVDDVKRLRVWGPFHGVFLVILLLTICWMLIPWIFRYHWGDAAYDSYVALVRIFRRRKSELALQLHPQGMEIAPQKSFTRTRTKYGARAAKLEDEDEDSSSSEYDDADSENYVFSFDVMFSLKRLFVSEGQYDAEIQLIRIGDCSKRQSVSVSTTPDTALAGVDYETVEHGPVTFLPGVRTAIARVPIIDNGIWEPVRWFHVSIDGSADPNNADIQNRTDCYCCKVVIVNDDRFPVDHQEDDSVRRGKFETETNFTRRTKRLLQYCTLINKELRLRLPHYFQRGMIFWYFCTYTFTAFHVNVVVPQIQKRFVNSILVENDHRWAVYLAITGLASECLKHRFSYAFVGSWAMARLHNMKLAYHLFSLSPVQLHDTNLAASYRKIFKDMEATIQATWHEVLKIFNKFLNVIVALTASCFLGSDWYLPPLIILCLIAADTLSKLVRWWMGWPDDGCFLEMEKAEGDIFSEIDNMVLNRTSIQALDVGHRNVSNFQKKYSAWIGPRNSSWYFADNAYWSGRLLNQSIFWGFMALSPYLIQDGQLTIGGFVALSGLLVNVSSYVEDLHNMMTRLRYGVAKLVYMTETLNTADDFANHEAWVAVCDDYKCFVEASLENDKFEPSYQSMKKVQELFSHIHMIDATYSHSKSFPPEFMPPTGAPHFAISNCTCRIPLGDRVYTLIGGDDDDCGLARLLGGSVLPQEGNVFFPPGVKVLYVPRGIPTVAGTLMENLRFGCGPEDECGLNDREVWNLCSRLGMKKELLGQNNLRVATNGHNLDLDDVAILYLAQNLLCRPDIIVFNAWFPNLERFLPVLRDFVDGKLLPCSSSVALGIRRTAILQTRTKGSYGSAERFVDAYLEVSKTIPATLTVSPKDR